MKIILFLLLIALAIGRAEAIFPNLDVYAADTIKQKKNKEILISSPLENETAKPNFQDATIFDITAKSTLVNVMVLVRDMDTKLPLTRVQLKMTDAKTGQTFEPVFSAADQGFSIKVAPETVVKVYVTAKGYTDASANINDIRTDRRMAFELQKAKPSVAKIKVLDEASERAILGSTVTIASKNTKNSQTITLDKGATDIVYDSPDAVELTAAAAGYNSTSKSLEIETALNGKSYEVVIKLKRSVAAPPVVVSEKAPEVKSLGALEKGKVITLNNIYFDQSSPVLRAESSPQLDELVDILKKDPSVRIEIRGHTDNVGDFELNIQLSRNRCQSVVDYLVQKGISANRLQIIGRGPVDAVAPNTTEENRKKNRRVEFVVL